MAVKERWTGRRPIGFSTQEALDLILPILQADERIGVAYLFGSRASGEAREGSDLDVAIFTTENFAWEEYYRLLGELTRVLHSDRVDLVWLNMADPVLKFLVVKEGKVLFYRDPDVLNAFEIKAKKGYYDYAIYLRKHRGE